MRRLLLYFTPLALLAADPSASQIGTDLGKQANQLFGSKEGVNSRFAKPLMGNSDMTTIDGSKSFNAAVQCPANAKSVGITFLPISGNDYRIIIRQDTNLDKSFDYTYDTNIIGGSVSGICTNGIISCNPPGSWENCQAYVWDTRDNKIYLKKTIQGAPEIGACYCSNSSCGVNSLVPQIYENVGGGISAAIMRNNPLFLLSKSEWNPEEMTYYLFGQNKTNCSGLASSEWDQYGEKNPKQYYETQTPPNISIADVEIKQGGDPNSLYSLISKQNEVSYSKDGKTISMPSRYSCTITKTINSNTEKKTKSYTATNTICVDHDIWIYLEYNKDTKNFRYDLGGAGPGSYMLSDGSIYDFGKNCGGQGWVNFFNRNLGEDLGFGNKTAGNMTYTVTMNVLAGAGCSVGSVSTNSYITNNGKVITKWFNSLCPAKGAQTPTLKVDVDISADVEDYKMSIDNRCATYESDSNCHILDEQICDKNNANCVYTIRNSIKQNVVPQKSCYNHSSSIEPTIICADGNEISIAGNSGKIILYSGKESWFYIKRTYECQKNDIDIDISKMHNTMVTANKEEGSTTIDYVDLDGNAKKITNVPNGDNCPNPVCTVHRPATDTQQFGDKTNRSQTAAGSKVIETVVKTCIKEGSSMRCPLENKETMVEDCSCVGGKVGFQQAITTLEAVNQAAKDMICSQN